MKASIAAQEILQVGTSTVVEASAPCSNNAVVFEDDGETGYFYALDHSKREPIQDALHIYDVKNVTDRSKPSTVQVVWTEDGTKALLLINRYPHAAFDFSAKQGFCRSDFPPPEGEWSKSGHAWHDAVLELFK
jgi:hypothetical protein